MNAKERCKQVQSDAGKLLLALNSDPNREINREFGLVLFAAAVIVTIETANGISDEDKAAMREHADGGAIAAFVAEHSTKLIKRRLEEMQSKRN